jgi:glycosyltransferase involved in cell wall biosynthesis
MYPPHHLGGYELLSREVVEHVRAHGHEVNVLTSWRGRRRPWREGRAYRWLRLCPPRERPTRAALLFDVAGGAYNRFVTALALRRWKPDVVVVFHCGAVGGAVVAWLHRQRRWPVIHDVCDTYLVHFHAADPWLSLPSAQIENPLLRAARAVLVAVGRPALGRPGRLDLRGSYFRSRWLLEQHVGASHVTADGATVIREGTPILDPSDTDASPAGSLLFTGRLVADKGPQVALDALARLSPAARARRPSLTVAGPVVDEGFGLELRETAEGLEGIAVRFLGHVPRSEVLEAMRSHAIFVYPPVWEEPSGGSLPEAMATGMAIVATGTGGSGELLVDGENCLLVAPGDSPGLARALERLILDDALRERLSAGALATAAQRPRGRALDDAEARIAAAVATTRR